MNSEHRGATDAKDLDLLGLKGVGSAIETVTKGVVNGTGAFLSRICLPAAEEFGLLLKDKVSDWRRRNIEEILRRSQRTLADDSIENVHCHPRVLASVIENGSWTDDELLQEMWSGLLVSSCNENGTDDGASIFVRLLTDCTPTQAKIVKAICDKVKVAFTSTGVLVASDSVEFDIQALREVTRISDLLHLDRELDNLRDLGLVPPIGAGFDPSGSELIAKLRPTSICLQLYAAVHGKGKSIKSFYETRDQIVVFKPPEGASVTLRFS